MNHAEKLSLNKIRCFNGNENAVERIGNFDKGYFLELLQSMNKYSRQDLLLQIMQNYSGITYSHYQWNKTRDDGQLLK